MSDISDTESTSSILITLTEANIMSSDINMLAVSQPCLPTPTLFDGSSPPFQEWPSELRTFLDINGFQYIPQMDIAFREDAPIQLHHLCSGTEVGGAAQDGITNDRAAIKTLRDELKILLIFVMMTRSIERLASWRQTSLFIKSTLMTNSPKSRKHLTTSATSWRIQPRQHQSRIITSVVFIRLRMGSNHGDSSGFVTVEEIALAPIPCCRTSWPPNGQSNINIINFEHGWRKLPAMRVNRA